MSIKIKKLNNTIIKCNKCPRLINFIKKIKTEKRRQNINEKYWGKPVPGFGDMDAKLLIVGLAPAAHGGTRTGRAFTGDKSGDFLFKTLFQTEISNQDYSSSLNDGLKLKSTFITNILKCVPPNDKPLKTEINKCSNYFNSELEILKNLKVIVTLGKVAFDNCVKYYKQTYKTKKKFTFKHGKRYNLPDGIILIPSYHPSPRNVNTKLINQKMFNKLFSIAKKLSKI
jgi:uracil-DNA glycosylase family 4